MYHNKDFKPQDIRCKTRFTSVLTFFVRVLYTRVVIRLYYFIPNIFKNP